MKVLYWMLTGVLCAASLVAGMAYLMEAQGPNMVLQELGYPTYLLPILGVWKVSGALTLLLPGLTRVKSWAYAGFFFLYSGAFLSHIAAGDGLSQAAPAMVMWILLIGSYMTRDHRLD